ncbi:hypothetical protein AMTR_s00093p00074290 [Amborella trichopoda]|uniref:Uncharacterized protein n=1 Tax=Amborella trichopoda TaxID=13333 RepID=W1NVU3_AMBTC|nr:hypothetical protein AMTR_s00093p00074290 [Amborella trichopoda]
MSILINVETVDEVPSAGVETSMASTRAVSEVELRAESSSKIPSSETTAPLDSEVPASGTQAEESSSEPHTVFHEPLALTIKDSALDVPPLAAIDSSTPPPSSKPVAPLGL